MGSSVYGKGYYDGKADGVTEAHKEDALLAAVVGGVAVIGVLAYKGYSWGKGKIEERSATKAEERLRNAEAMAQPHEIEDPEGTNGTAAATR
ncbi:MULTISPECIES: hypothetical protein [Arthrobacter]|uniref:Uncharacterized protein n=2 Tax=Arthrobacter TaxID=1663 RepID=A0ABU9KIX5_9MICC|nr:hypothetical protein [Arthrobacter sp. YJM1]MDP5225870.1 hypothetical protein [Arthrobacter sp. YJM1]